LPPVDIDVKAKTGIFKVVVIPVRELSKVSPAIAR
jgi:hypothetical protein